jgi:hypothetical protein
VPEVGKRQRHTHLVGYSVEQLEWMLKDKHLPKAERLKVVAELKFWRERNRQKRAK